MSDLLKKYNIPVPRYTSYPPANLFTEQVSDEDYRLTIKESNAHQPAHLSFYIHIPFCKKMCFYCGCNKSPLGNDETIANYMAALKKEINQILPLLSTDRKIAQIHFGGGTPNAIPSFYIKDIVSLFTNHFPVLKEAEIAIECNPAYLTLSYLDELIAIGFNRVSLGIQDFDTSVLKAVNRDPSALPIATIVQHLKQHRIAVNMDFIYGLPLQSVEKFTNTIKQAIDLQPDRLVTFSYAHVPWVSPLQKQLEKIGLPDSETKLAIYQQAANVLAAHGYKAIGMDHFVLPTDELFQAQQQGYLHRNFQGYCTKRTTGQVYAFGVSAISQLTQAYAQNTKSIEEYIHLMNENKLATHKGYLLSKSDIITREIITELMCNKKIQWKSIAATFNITLTELKSFVYIQQEQMDELVDDQLITIDADGIDITEIGMPYIRNVATVFDKLYQLRDQQFSTPI